MVADLSEQTSGQTSWLLISLFLLETKLSPTGGEAGGAGLLVLDGDDVGAVLGLLVNFMAWGCGATWQSTVWAGGGGGAALVWSGLVPGHGAAVAAHWLCAVVCTAGTGAGAASMGAVVGVLGFRYAA